MARAINPPEMPAVPERYTEWRRSRRAGSVYHLRDAVGVTACRSLVLERHTSEAPRGLGDVQYWGCCPRCFAISVKESANA